VFATTTTGYATGVPLIDVTADYYYWAQVGGVAPILTDGSETNVIGDPTGPPATYATAGSCGVYVTLNQQWGNVLHVGGGDNEPALINLAVD